MSQAENTLQLVTPIVRGDTVINSVELIKPNAGTLR
ncbi:MAG TPA: phage tail assembly protein, partial [Erwinia persicina]|nr:phage tail assembly protein [Erwinia persicina]